jgi:hypothetical protein
VYTCAVESESQTLLVRHGKNRVHGLARKLWNESHKSTLGFRGDAPNRCLVTKSPEIVAWKFVKGKFSTGLLSILLQTKLIAHSDKDPVHMKNVQSYKIGLGALICVPYTGPICLNNCAANVTLHHYRPFCKQCAEITVQGFGIYVQELC